MVFSSAVFLMLFLPITFILNYFVRKEYSNILLLIASLIFYAWGEPVLILLMIFSIIFNWLIGRFIGELEGNKKRIALIIGVLCDIGIIGYYKYSAFLVSIINGIAKRELLTVLIISRQGIRIGT